jgi:hypothetical protein
MIVRRFMCPEHGEQDTRIADGGLARCALCGQHMTPVAPPDPRVHPASDPRRQKPPRGEVRPL